MAIKSIYDILTYNINLFRHPYLVILNSKIPTQNKKQTFFKKTSPTFGGFKKTSYLCIAIEKNSCPDGGIGRRAGLKHQWSNIHPGSTPGLGTTKRAKYF